MFSFIYLFLNFLDVVLRGGGKFKPEDFFKNVNFCQKGDFGIVNFVKNETLQMTEQKPTFLI